MEEWKSDEDEEKKEYENMLKQVRSYVDILEDEVEKGDKVSKRILERLDNRVRRIRRRRRRVAHISDISRKMID